MGFSIRHIKKNDTWQATCSISDEKMLDTPGTKEDLKKVFIERIIWKFLKDMIKLEMEFPFQWSVNNKICFERDGEMFGEWWLRKNKEGTLSSDIYKKSIEIVEKYDLKEYFDPLINGIKLDEDGEF